MSDTAEPLKVGDVQERDLTQDELEAALRDAVAAAGGAKKWARKHDVSMAHALHMLDNGSAATLGRVLQATGYQRVVMVRYRKR